MTLDLSSLTTVSSTTMPIILTYGVAGMGKTSLALNAPDPVYFQIAPERPPAGVSAPGFADIEDFSSLMEGIAAIYSEAHPFKTMVLDSLDALEALVWRETCLRNNWRDLEQPGYGKGYLAADVVWRELITACDALRTERGMLIMWLALAEATNHEEPGAQPYKRYDLKLHKRATGLLTQAADALLFVNTKVVLKESEAGFGKKNVHAEGGGTRWLFADARPAFNAKNRMGMPDMLQLPKASPWAALAPYLPSESAEEQAA
jgi:hypothetical protein